MASLSRFGAIAVSVAVPVVAGMSPAWAQASASTVHTTTSGAEAGPNPCTGAAGTFTFSADEVIHTTADGSGGFHLSMTATSDDRFVPDDPSQPTYSGRDTLHVDSQEVRARSTTTFVQAGELTAPEGSSVRFFSFYHVTVAADGTPTAIRSVGTFSCS